MALSRMGLNRRGKTPRPHFSENNPHFFLPSCKILPKLLSAAICGGHFIPPERTAFAFTAISTLKVVRLLSLSFQHLRPPQVLTMLRLTSLAARPQHGPRIFMSRGDPPII